MRVNGHDDRDNADCRPGKWPGFGPFGGKAAYYSFQPDSKALKGIQTTRPSKTIKNTSQSIALYGV